MMLELKFLNTPPPLVPPHYDKIIIVWGLDVEYVLWPTYKFST